MVAAMDKGYFTILPLIKERILTVNELLSIASLVEKKVLNRRPQGSRSVFYNRLNVRYAAKSIISLSLYMLQENLVKD